MKSDMKHRIIWETWIGGKYMDLMTWAGLKLLRGGRRLIKRGRGRCTWCGANPGFNSVVSRKGLRCDSIVRRCADYPDTHE